MFTLAATEARPKLGALYLVIGRDCTPGLVANRAGNVDFQTDCGHGKESRSDEMNVESSKILAWFLWRWGFSFFLEQPPVT